MSVPALLHALILREIDVTLITRHIQSHFETIIDPSKTTDQLMSEKQKIRTEIDRYFFRTLLFTDLIIHGLNFLGHNYSRLGLKRASSIRDNSMSDNVDAYGLYTFLIT